MKGLFIPEITAEMFRNGCLESIESLMAEGEIYDIEYSKWIPVSERLPEENEYIKNVCKYYLIQDEHGDMHVAHLSNVGWIPMDSLKAIGDEVIAWRELPLPYKEEQDGE